MFQHASTRTGFVVCVLAMMLYIATSAFAQGTQEPVGSSNASPSKHDGVGGNEPKQGTNQDITPPPASRTQGNSTAPRHADGTNMQNGQQNKKKSVHGTNPSTAPGARTSPGNGNTTYPSTNTPPAK
jgi:hypothetical protein